MPTPTKGPRMGRDPAHQRLMLANLAASLFEVEHVVTTVSKAKALRPYAEQLITKAKRGSVHDHRNVVATIHDKRDAQAVRRDRRGMRSGRVGTCASSSSVRARATTRRWRASNWSDPAQVMTLFFDAEGSLPSVAEEQDEGQLGRRAAGRARARPSAAGCPPAEARRRVRRHRLPRVRRPRRCSDRRRDPHRRSRRCCAPHARSSSWRARGAPTPGCTRGAKLSACKRPKMSTPRSCATR